MYECPPEVTAWAHSAPLRGRVYTMPLLRAHIATGEIVLHRTDLRLPGYIPLRLARIYRSGRGQSGVFGHGWRLNWALTLRAGSDEITYAPGTPHEVPFTPIEEGMQARHATGALLQHPADAYIVVPAPSRRLVFEKEDAQNGVIPLSRIEDQSGNGVHFFYNGGRIAGIVDTVGRQIRFEYQGGQVSRICLEGGDGPASTVRTFQYSGSGDLVEETDAAGHTASFGYHGHLMTEYTLRNGGTQYAQYDDDRRCLALWYADESEVRHLAYDESRKVTRVTKGDGRQVLYQHVQPGQVLERTDPVDQNQNYYYNETRQLIGFSDEHGVVQTFQQLDLEEEKGTFLEAEERGAFLELDEHMCATNVLDPLENQHTLSYGDHGHPIQLQTPSGYMWTFRRDERGSVTKVTGPTGQSIRLTRSSDGRKLAVEDDEERRTEDHFDERGRLVERVDPLRRRFQWRYDANGRLRSVRAGGKSMEFKYSPGGFPTRVVDAANRVTEMRRDAFGRLQEFTLGDDQYNLDYDAAGRVATVDGPEGSTTELEYGGSGRLAEIHHANGSSTSYNHMEEGTEVVTEGSGGVTRSVYNQAGDPVRWKKPGEPEHHLEYGPSGELLSVEWKDYSLFFDYDGERRLVEVTDIEGGETLQVDYGTNDGIQTIRRDGDQVVACERDACGRLIGLKGPSQNLELTYDAGDRLSGIQEGDGVWRFKYDAFDRLVEIKGHRDLDGETPSDDVQTRALTFLGWSDGQGRKAEVKLHTARRGVALSLHTGRWCLPIWRQGDCLSPLPSFPPSLVAATIVVGEELLIDPLRPFFRPRLPLHWRQLATRGVRWDYAEIPSPATLGSISWSALDRFFLDRSFYEMGHRSLLPNERDDMDRRRERSPDPWVTGSHVTGELRPPIWTHQAAGTHLHHRALGPGAAPKSALDVLEMIQEAASWN